MLLKTHFYYNIFRLLQKRDPFQIISINVKFIFCLITCIFYWYTGLLCAIIYKQWVLNNGNLVYFINNIIIFEQLK